MKKSTARSCRRFEILGKIEVFPICKVIKRAVNTADGLISFGRVAGSEAVNSADICTLCGKNAGKRVLKDHTIFGTPAKKLCRAHIYLGVGLAGHYAVIIDNSIPRKPAVKVKIFKIKTKYF